jgi:CheY-like chemotaxis protein
LNALFLNATTNINLSAIQGFLDLGHEVKIANSLNSAIRSIEANYPDLIVIDASLEFSSTDAIMYLRRIFSGGITAIGDSVTSATRQFLEHVGIPTVAGSFADVVSQQALGTKLRVAVLAA